ncbi:hypothetical protein [Paenibacillus sp. Marseille-Q4541]|uniref:hypothetical protein n=1 Tax=Paenibacillus sp. Marseille-Q4541 TaxID=2831522 RepID=UPI001BA7BF89|nr:hypothetical protein [Paenibacillus sp. Marseille-Q4541]
MVKTETIPFNQFFNNNSEDEIKNTLVEHLNKYKIVYRIIGTTIIIFASGIIDPSAFAAPNGIDIGGARIYEKLVGLGKWVIIFKGGWDTIQNTIKGDFDMAKRAFLQYLMVYIILLALPWSLKQVDTVFSDM